MSKVARNQRTASAKASRCFTVLALVTLIPQASLAGMVNGNAPVKAENTNELTRKIEQQETACNTYKTTINPFTHKPDDAQIQDCEKKLENLKSQLASATASESESEKSFKDASSKCQADNYKECYCGISWGSVMNKDRGDGASPIDELGSGNFSDKLNCDTNQDMLTLRKKSKIMTYVVGGKDSTCNFIILNKKLVGFFYLDEHTSDEILYLTSKLKSKYGANPRKTSCSDQNGERVDRSEWDNSGGLNILFLTSKSTSNIKNKDMYVRYLNKAAFQDAVANEAKNESQDKDAKEDKKINKLGDGL